MIKRQIAFAGALAGLAVIAAGCGGGTGGASYSPSANGTAGSPAPAGAGSPAPSITPTSTASTPTPRATASAGPAGTPTPTPLPTVASMSVATGFAAASIASAGSPRELAFLPNGDLLAGTTSSSILIVPQADGPGGVAAPKTFYTASEGPAAGVAYGPDGAVYFGTQHAVWRLAYRSGDQSEAAGSAVKVATVRTSTVREDHVTTSVAVSATTVYASVGSSSNDTWPEIDATRATIQQTPLGTSTMTSRAVQVRNGIGLAIDPASGHLWVAGAGQDSTPYGHPYEYADDVDGHPGVANYGWPMCEENHIAYRSGMDCSQQAVPRVEFPAYATHIGLTFYPANQTGPYAFPPAYRGGLFVTSHGSWHCCPSALPNVAFVPMNGDMPATPVNWNDPTVQWQKFFFTPADSTSSSNYYSRPTGVAVGPNGSLFVADDGRNAIYRIRPQ